MPKLTQNVAKKVAEIESSFEVLPEGPYTVWLEGVDASQDTSAGDPMWIWTFVVADGDHKGRKLWQRTYPKNEKAFFVMKQIFDAYGVPTDTDTDDLCGASKLVRAAVSQGVIEKGARKGELGNNIDRIMAYDGDSADEPSIEVGDDDSDVFGD